MHKEKIKNLIQNKTKGLIKPFVMLTFYLVLSGHLSFGQDRVLDVGLRLQKTVNLYFENGLTVQYSDDRLLSQRIYLGFSYISSRLGTAIGSNAIKQDNFLLSVSYYFRPQRVIQPFVRLNGGYFFSNLEEPIFDELPSNSMLLSPEGGIAFHTRTPLKINASLGYNVITGNGLSGPGTLFPLFVQTSITWNILKNNSL